MQVFSGPEGGVWVSKHPKQFYISIFIILGGLEAKKCHFSKILIPENSNFLSFQGPQGVPLRFFLAKNGSKSSVLPWIEKSWPFGPQKIALKESYGGFPLGGALKAPPLLIGLIRQDETLKCFLQRLYQVRGEKQLAVVYFIYLFIVNFAETFKKYLIKADKI